MGKLWFPLAKWIAIGTKVATGTTTLTGFYDGVAGTITRFPVSVVTQNTPDWVMASMPEFSKTVGGGEVPGALFHVIYHTPTQFVVCVERLTGGPSEPLTGNLALTWTRRGKTH